MTPEEVELLRALLFHPVTLTGALVLGAGLASGLVGYQARALGLDPPVTRSRETRWSRVFSFGAFWLVFGLGAVGLSARALPELSQVLTMALATLFSLVPTVLIVFFVSRYRLQRLGERGKNQESVNEEVRLATLFGGGLALMSLANGGLPVLVLFAVVLGVWIYQRADLREGLLAASADFSAGGTLRSQDWVRQTPPLLECEPALELVGPVGLFASTVREGEKVREIANRELLVLSRRVRFGAAAGEGSERALTDRSS